VPPAGFRIKRGFAQSVKHLNRIRSKKPATFEEKFANLIR